MHRGTSVCGVRSAHAHDSRPCCYLTAHLVPGPSSNILFLRAGEPPEAITVGFLKHRDIDGNAMPSQLFPEPEEEEEEEEEEDMGLCWSPAEQEWAISA